MNIGINEAKTMDDAKTKPPAFLMGDSPPLSPSITKSGESTPKSPITPPEFEEHAIKDRKGSLKDDIPSMNGVLPPLVTPSDSDLEAAPEQCEIIPPPKEFQAAEDRRCSVPLLNSEEARARAALIEQTRRESGAERREVRLSDLFPSDDIPDGLFSPTSDDASWPQHAQYQQVCMVVEVSHQRIDTVTPKKCMCAAGSLLASRGFTCIPNTNFHEGNAPRRASFG